MRIIRHRPLLILPMTLIAHSIDSIPIEPLFLTGLEDYEAPPKHQGRAHATNSETKTNHAETTTQLRHNIALQPGKKSDAMQPIHPAHYTTQ
jgi:hypothetical protein